MLCLLGSSPSRKSKMQETLSSSLPVYWTKSFNVCPSNSLFSLLFCLSLSSTRTNSWAHLFIFSIYPATSCLSASSSVYFPCFLHSVKAAYLLNQGSFSPSPPILTMAFLFHFLAIYLKTFLVSPQLIRQEGENSLKGPARVSWICRRQGERD